MGIRDRASRGVVGDNMIYLKTIMINNQVCRRVKILCHQQSRPIVALSHSPVRRLCISEKEYVIPKMCCVSIRIPSQHSRLLYRIIASLASGSFFSNPFHLVPGTTNKYSAAVCPSLSLMLSRFRYCSAVTKLRATIS